MRAYLGLGSNLGDRLENLRSACDELQKGGVLVLRSSRVYETEPVGGPPQPPYLNAVVEVETDLDPRALLRACLEAESSLGRVREERWGPRTIDIDVLTYEDLEVQEPDLELPHPRAHERTFVLAPLLELDPSPSLAGDPRPDQAGVRPFAPPLV